MGFFNDLKKNVTDVGQKAAQKTRDFADISRINSLISQNDSKINNLYIQIGKLFVNKYEIDCDDDFRGMIDAIHELEKQNIDLGNQIQDIKGIQRCEKCGAENPREAIFCSSCGASLLAVEKKIDLENYVKCPHCGNMVANDARFCTSCGQEINIVVVTSVEVEEETDAILDEKEESAVTYEEKTDTVSVEVEEEQRSFEGENKEDIASYDEKDEIENKVCPNCGAKLTDEAAFCIECGTKL